MSSSICLLEYFSIFGDLVDGFFFIWGDLGVNELTAAVAFRADLRGGSITTSSSLSSSSELNSSQPPLPAFLSLDDLSVHFVATTFDDLEAGPLSAFDFDLTSLPVALRTLSRYISLRFAFLISSAFFDSCNKFFFVAFLLSDAFLSFLLIFGFGMTTSSSKNWNSSSPSSVSLPEEESLEPVVSITSCTRDTLVLMSFADFAIFSAANCASLARCFSIAAA